MPTPWTRARWSEKNWNLCFFVFNRFPTPIISSKSNKTRHHFYWKPPSLSCINAVSRLIVLLAEIPSAHINCGALGTQRAGVRGVWAWDFAPLVGDLLRGCGSFLLNANSRFRRLVLLFGEGGCSYVNRWRRFRAHCPSVNATTIRCQPLAHVCREEPGEGRWRHSFSVVFRVLPYVAPSLLEKTMAEWSESRLTRERTQALSVQPHGQTGLHPLFQPEVAILRTIDVSRGDGREWRTSWQQGVG